MENTKWPNVYVILLNWNNYNCSRRCLDSLQQVTYPNVKVIVVDNGSTDGSGERLKAEPGHHRFIFNDTNLGFARGCNVGIRAALESADCAYALLLNNDAIVTPAFLEDAIATAEADRDIGLIGGKLLDSVEGNRIAYAGGSIDRFRAGCRMRGSFELDRGQYDKPSETRFVVGALMLIRREVFDTVGLLPEEYFFGVEDVDYSLNVRQSGYKLYYVPTFTAYHRGDGSHSTYAPKFAYNGYRSRFIFQEKYLPRGLFPIWQEFFIVYEKYLSRLIRLKRHRHQVVQEPRSKDLEFALSKAIEDHGRDVLSEEVLNRFVEISKGRKGRIAER